MGGCGHVMRGHMRGRNQNDLLFDFSSPKNEVADATLGHQYTYEDFFGLGGSGAVSQSSCSLELSGVGSQRGSRRKFSLRLRLGEVSQSPWFGSVRARGVLTPGDPPQ